MLKAWSKRAAESFVEKTGFSIIELIVVVVIISIVTAFAIPSYHKAMERGRSEQAIANLKSIYNAEKRYHFDTGAFYTCSPCTLAAINENLEIDVTDAHFTYEITDAGATATRVGGRYCPGLTITLNFDTVELDDSACSAW